MIPTVNNSQVNISFDAYNGSISIGYNSLSRTFSFINENQIFSVSYLDNNSTTTSITDGNPLIIRNNSKLQINTTSLLIL